MAMIRTGGCSIDVAAVAFLGSQAGDVLGGLVGVKAAADLYDLVECGVHVACHAGGVAADEEGCSFLEPTPELGGVFEHPVLDVDFSGLVA